jgi:tetratricopeptide (TPR) repeat protein
VMPKVDIPYDAHGIAMTRKQYGDALSETGRHREAAEQYLQAAQLVQDDPDNRVAHAELAWYAAQSLQDAGLGEESVAAYRRAAGLWGELGQVSPRVRCLRSAAWVLHWMSEADEPSEPGESSGEAAMRAVLAELESLAAADDPSEEVLEELTETRRQLTGMIGEREGHQGDHEHDE